MYIDDGKGKGFQVGVNSDNQLLSKSITIPQYAFQSFLKGNEFIWVSSYAATAADYVFSLRNDDQVNSLRISRFILSSTVATLWTFIKVTGGTPAGTLVTGVNTNFSSGRLATVTCYGNAAVTGSPTGSPFLKVYTPISTHSAFETNGSIVLPANTAIAVQASTTGTVAVTISGWFEAVEGA